MKIHSNLCAGMTFAECDAARNRMKRATENGDCSALGGSQPSYATQLPSYPTYPTYPVYPTQLPSFPPSTGYPPQQPTYPAGQQVESGGYYGGVYYTDRSGWCG